MIFRLIAIHDTQARSAHAFDAGIFVSGYTLIRRDSRSDKGNKYWILQLASPPLPLCSPSQRCRLVVAGENYRSPVMLEEMILSWWRRHVTVLLSRYQRALCIFFLRSTYTQWCSTYAGTDALPLILLSMFRIKTCQASYCRFSEVRLRDDWCLMQNFAEQISFIMIAFSHAARCQRSLTRRR